MIGKTLSHYRILGVLGAGGMGVVYSAEDQRLGRQVALKFLPADALESPQALDRFRLEARTASSLSHPNICAIYDIGVHEHAPFIVMELLKGETLRERVARGPLKITDVLDITIQLADALGAAHQQGVVHRDIKPANIFVGDKSRVKILDFGLAKLAREHSLQSTGAAVDVTSPADTGRIGNPLTVPGTAIGTVSYMSPEQARGEDVDARTDIFSLGVVLYEMVTGRQAFGGSTSAVVFDAILNRAPTSPLVFNPEVPPRLVESINSALEKERDLRYQHATDFEADLKRIRRDLQSGATASATSMVAAAAADTRPGAPRTATAYSGAPASAPAAATVATATTPAPPARAGWPWWLAAAALASMTAALAFFGRGGAGMQGGSGAPQVAAPSAAAQAFPTAPTTPAAQRPAETTPAAQPVTPAAPPTAAPSTPPHTTSGSPRPPAVPARPVPEPARPSGRTVPTPSGGPAPVVQPPASTPPVVTLPASAAPPPNAPTPPAPAAPVIAPPLEPAPPPAPTAPAPSAPATSTPAPAPAAPAPAVTPTAAPSPQESDEAAIARVIERYERAIETKDLAMFRSVRPGLTADEERRLRTAFEQVGKQQIEMRIEHLTITGDTAVVRLARLDVVETAGRSQSSRTTQTLQMAKRPTGWIIVGPGR